MGWKHYQTDDHPKREPQVGSGLYPPINSSLHISIFQIHQINLSFEKKISLSKSAQKFTQNRLTVVNETSIEI